MESDRGFCTGQNRQCRYKPEALTGLLGRLHRRPAGAPTIVLPMNLDFRTTVPLASREQSNLNYRCLGERILGAC